MTDEDLALRSHTDKKSAEEEDPNVYCASCAYIITQKKHSFPVHGSVQHVFTNPHGYVFEIACYRRAPGAAAAGENNSDFSWFEGYVWDYVFCKSCLDHLGWKFRLYPAGGKEKEDEFFGLILNKLQG
jgi:hypothetical protein